MKVGNVILEEGQCIAPGVDRDEKKAGITADLRLGYQLIRYPLECAQSCGADVGAVGIAEEDEGPLTLELLQSQRLAVVVAQDKVAKWTWLRQQYRL